MNTQITRREFIRFAGTSTALLLSGCGSAATLISAARSKTTRSRLPNIIYILADDLGYGDLTCLNRESKIPTPNIDRVAAEGVHFTDAHSPSAVCTPTRYGILTGRYCWRTSLKKGVLNGYSPCLIETSRLTVPALLRNHGYRTACIGKWHLGLGTKKTTDFAAPLRPGPLELGFDSFFGIPASLDMPPYCYIENDRPVAAPTETIEAGDNKTNEFWRAGPISPGFRHIDVLSTLTDRAVETISSHREKYPQQPLFLYFPLTAPHTPWVPIDSVRGKSRAGRYGDFVVQVDQVVGRILKAIDDNGMRDNTLVIFTSDNGSHIQHIDPKFGHRANYVFLGQKSDAWEGGHRIPFLARWPGRIPAASTSRQLICLTDLMATAAAIVGEALPETAAEDSFNFLPALEGKQIDGFIRPAIVLHSVNGMFAIRRDHWKLIVGRGSGGWSKRPGDDDPDSPPGQLYDLSTDIEETTNLYTKHPDIVKELSALLDRYQSSGRSRT
jgi:arylsulfatase A-like enzyme